MDNTVGSLTEEQKSILIGTLLGDGTMRKKKNAHLEINHCFDQKVLVDWMFAKFKNLVKTLPKWRRGNGSRQAYRFATQKLQILTPYYDWFYRNNKKIIPVDLTLSPLQLINLLRSQFGIDATLNKDKSYYRIRIRTRSVKRFIELVKEFVLEEFQYKFPSVMTL